MCGEGWRSVRAEFSLARFQVSGATPSAFLPRFLDACHTPGQPMRGQITDTSPANGWSLIDCLIDIGHTSLSSPSRVKLQMLALSSFSKS